jgi:hypothetical protein
MAPLAICGLALICSPSHAATITNGDFEQPGTGAFTFLTTDSTFITGWTFTSNGEQIGYNQSGANGGVPAQSGNYYVSWGHSTTTGGQLAQTFATTPGATYTLTYYLELQQGDNANSATATLTDASTSAILATQMTAITDPTFVQIWQQETLSFIAAGNTTTLTFFDSTPAFGGGSSNWGLDTVSIAGLSDDVSSTPLPASLPLLGSALAGLGWLGQRRRRARTTRS